MKTNEFSDDNIKSPFKYNLLAIQPSQLFINSEKLTKVKESFSQNNLRDMGPLPVKLLDHKLIFTDGHTRAVWYYLNGFKTIMVEWDDPWGSEFLDKQEYEISLQWCLSEGVFNVKDLANRIVSNEEYEILWIERCQKMHASTK